MIADGMTVAAMAAEAGCTDRQLRRIRDAFGLTSPKSAARAAAVREEWERQKEDAIPRGKGGDAAFAELMAGKQFGYPRPSAKRSHGPVPLPRPLAFSQTGNAAQQCAAWAT
jgi:hypothetical protein